MTPLKPVYGWKDHIYCAPFADWLATSADARRLLFQKLDRPDFEECGLLANEQNELRHTKFWWKNVYCPDKTCTCEGLSGTEIDVFMVFENPTGKRLALHVACINPDDAFSKAKQGSTYASRASCWLNAQNRPAKVLPHDACATLLLTDDLDRHGAEQVAAFDHSLTFGWIGDYLAPYPDPALRYHGAASTWVARSIS